MNLNDLAAPFAADEVEWRVQREVSGGAKAMVLCYVTARAIMDRLDAVCGPENWRDQYDFMGDNCMCGLSVRVDGEWITKWDGAPPSNVESMKGSISGALKRAAVKWGIGRYLYQFPTTFVDFKAQGQHYHKQGKCWDAPNYSAIMAKLSPSADPAAQRVAETFGGTPVDELEQYRNQFRAGWKQDKARMEYALRQRGHDDPKAIQDNAAELMEVLKVFDDMEGVE